MDMFLDKFVVDTSFEYSSTGTCHGDWSVVKRCAFLKIGQINVSFQPSGILRVAITLLNMIVYVWCIASQYVNNSAKIPAVPAALPRDVFFIATLISSICKVKSGRFEFSCNDLTACPVLFQRLI